MIPKVIHYCWFGGKPIPKEYMKYIDSWKKYLPDYEIKRWDESNFDIHCNKFVEAAYNAGKYAFVSDFARFQILANRGGYFDTDVEVIRSLDEIKEMLALVDDAERVLTDTHSDLDDFGRMLDHTWKLKRQTGAAVSTNSIELLKQIYYNAVA